MNLVLCGGYRLHMLQKFAPNYDHIYMFEPNADMVHMASPENVTWIRAAAWTRTETKRFWVDDKGYGSSLLEYKTTRGTRKEWSDSYDVQCMDLVGWLYQAGKCDMCMDIEGAEYDVLPHLLDNYSCLKDLQHIKIEWHGKRIGMSQFERDTCRRNIVSRLDALGIEVSTER
jgi:FkbM family methyltransferase